MDKEDNPIGRLMAKVALGNPGALRVIFELMWFSHWHEMIVWMDKTRFVGSKIWEKYKDEFHQDSHAFGHWIQDQMYKDREKNDKIIPKKDRLHLPSF